MHWSRTYIDAIIYHTRRKQHTFLQAFNMFITFINRKYDCRSKIDKITYFIKNSFHNQQRRCNVPSNHRPACSLISQQRCHPRVGHDSPRNKGTSRLTLSQGYRKHSQSNTVGFIRPSRSWERIKAKLVSPLRAKDTYTRTILNSRTPTHTRHKEINPFSTT